MRPAYEVANDDSGFATESEIEEAVRRGWERGDGALVRELEFRDFDEAIGFARELGQEAVDWFRRPDMQVAAGHLGLRVENRHHAGFTKAEIRLVNKASDAIDRRRR